MHFAERTLFAIQVVVLRIAKAMPEPVGRVLFLALWVPIQRVRIPLWRRIHSA